MRPPDAIRQLWPDPNSGPWILTVEFAPVEGRIQVVGVSLRAYRVVGENSPDWMPQVIPGHYDDEHDRLVKMTPGIQHGSLTIRDASGRVSKSVDVHPMKPITTSDLRTIRLGEVLEAARPKIAEMLESLAAEQAAGDWPIPKDLTSKTAERASRYAQAPKGKGGRPPLSDDYLRQVARVYVEAWRARIPVNQAVRETFGISKHTAAKHIARARAAGLLPPTKKGTAKA